MILPFHRDDHFLRIAIKSILESEGVSVRLLLIDDRRNFSLIPDLDSHIVHRTGGLGYAGALNSAKPYLESEFVALMNSDDWSSPDRLVKQITELERREGDIAICSLAKFKSSRMIPALLGEYKSHDFDCRVLLLGAYGADATWLTRRDTWKSSFHFEESLVSDWLSAMKILPKLKVVSVDEKLYWYRQHTNQVTKMSIQQNEAFMDLLIEAAEIAKPAGLFDENFDMNFQITAAPYSLKTQPSKKDFLAAWKYLQVLESISIPGTSNLISRRKFLVAIRLAHSGYLNFSTVKSILAGALEIIYSTMKLLCQRPPRLLKEWKGWEV